MIRVFPRRTRTPAECDGAEQSAPKRQWQADVSKERAYRGWVQHTAVSSLKWTRLRFALTQPFCVGLDCGLRLAESLHFAIRKRRRRNAGEPRKDRSLRKKLRNADELLISFRIRSVWSGGLDPGLVDSCSIVADRRILPPADTGGRDFYRTPASHAGPKLRSPDIFAACHRWRGAIPPGVGARTVRTAATRRGCHVVGPRQRCSA